MPEIKHRVSFNIPKQPNNLGKANTKSKSQLHCQFGRFVYSQFMVETIVSMFFLDTSWAPNILIFQTHYYTVIMVTIVYVPSNNGKFILNLWVIWRTQWRIFNPSDDHKPSKRWWICFWVYFWKQANCIKIPRGTIIAEEYRWEMALYSYSWHSVAAFVDLEYAVLFCDARV